MTGYDPNTGKFHGAPAPVASGSGSGAYDPSAQAAMYDPSAVAGASGSGTGEGTAPKPKKAGSGKRETVIRKGNGKVWEDTTLVDWDPSELIDNFSTTREFFQYSGG